MTLTTILRLGAVALIVVGIIDPTWTVQRTGPVPVDLRVARDSGSSGEAVAAMRERLADALAGDVVFNSALEPKEVVVAGASMSSRSVPSEDVPVSTIAVTPS